MGRESLILPSLMMDYVGTDATADMFDWHLFKRSIAGKLYRKYKIYRYKRRKAYE